MDWQIWNRDKTQKLAEGLGEFDAHDLMKNGQWCFSQNAADFDETLSGWYRKVTRQGHSYIIAAEDL